MQKKNASELLEKIRNGSCTAEEKAIVQSWYLQWKQTAPPELPEEEFLASLENIRAALPKPEPDIRKIRFYRIAAAATTTIIFALSLIFVKYQRKPRPAAQQELVNDIKGGGNRAVLTLSNGQKVILDDQVNQQQISGTEKNIIRSGRLKGELVYDATAKTASSRDAALTNTIVTPRAGQYKVLLSDGTQVWLNAESSVRFPVVFNGNSREVEITGEAYFEVAKKTKKHSGQRIPFIVKTPKQQVEVLGTHFNINCYENEASTNTTLLEGAVRVSLLPKAKNSKPEIWPLRPGQQSRLTGQTFHITAVDTEEETAWKNGTIAFANADIKSIMRQVSRWYNVDVKYKGTIPGRTFTGSISRSAKLSELLKILQFSKINFSLSGSELTVLP